MEGQQIETSLKYRVGSLFRQCFAISCAQREPDAEGNLTFATMHHCGRLAIDANRPDYWFGKKAEAFSCRAAPLATARRVAGPPGQRRLPRRGPALDEGKCAIQ